MRSRTSGAEQDAKLRTVKPRAVIRFNSPKALLRHKHVLIFMLSGADFDAMLHSRSDLGAE